MNTYFNDFLGFEGFSEQRSCIEKPRSSRDETDLRSVKSPEDVEPQVEQNLDSP